MRHVQHLSLENLVKMDHFQKEPPLNLKGTTGGQGGRVANRCVRLPLKAKRTAKGQADIVEMAACAAHDAKLEYGTYWRATTFRLERPATSFELA